MAFTIFNLQIRHEIAFTKVPRGIMQKYTSKNMVLVQDTSSHHVLQMYEVSSNYLKRLSTSRADTIL